MDKSIVLLGDPSIVRPLLADHVYVEKEDVFLLFTDRTSKDYLLQKFQSSGVAAYTYEQYMGALKKTCTYEPIASLDDMPAYDWLGSEYFGLLSSGRFSLYKVTRKDAEEVAKTDCAKKVLMSNTGVFFAILQDKKVNVRVGFSFKNFLTIKRHSKIDTISFDHEDKYIAVCSQGTTVVYDLARGRKVLEEAGSEVLFSDKGVYVGGGESERFFPLPGGESSDGDIVSRVDQISLDNAKRDFPTKRLFSEDRRRSVEFFDGTPQKIVYSENGKTYTKTQANIHDLDFYFSKNKIYAVIAKKNSSTIPTPAVPSTIAFSSYSAQRQSFLAASLSAGAAAPVAAGPSYTYTVESYSGTEIRSTTLPAKPLSFSGSDSAFVVFDSSGYLRFFKRDKYGFQLVESLRKMGSGIVSMVDDVLCFYDSASSAVEFYDTFRLRAVHPQQGCTAMCWSKSGMYVACYELGTENGFLQIFNLDGELVYRKTSARLESFQWRPYLEASPEEIMEAEKRPAVEKDQDESSDYDESTDVFYLLSQWKAYLETKRNIHYK